MDAINNGSYENITTAERNDYDSFYEFWGDRISPFYTDLDKVIIPIIMPIVITIGIIGNVMTIIVIASKKCMHIPINVYFANLAVADTLYLIVEPDIIWNSYLKSPMIHNLYDIGEVPNWVCPLIRFLTYTGEYVALLTIFWLSVERYMAVCKPLKFQQSGFGICSRSLKICGIIWFLCLSWNVHFLVAVRTKTYKFTSSISSLYNLPNIVTQCELVKDSSILWYVERAVTALMILIMVSLYTAIVISVRKSRITIAGIKPRSKSEIKISLTAFVTVTVYVVCMAPYYIYMILNYKINASLLTIFHLMGYINSSVNPVIYNVINYNFRRAFCDVYCSRCKIKKNTPTIVHI
ncbi:kappa-type opioid receptor-like [Anneissia japonica]|uniref:kappa-type opioid receptor-like n=1 Tax=Anneissia japonica TaxID=1529436 RepID=UPI0014258A0E|nr:kappa-type opioid receptor-like [Anneissia japonica]